MFLIKNKINIYLYFFFLLFILVFIKFSTTIVFADNYTVKNIKIKEQYDINFNKDEVIKKGFKKGFKTLIFRIVESKDKNLFKNVPSNKINSLIDNFSITNEKFTDYFLYLQKYLSENRISYYWNYKYNLKKSFTKANTSSASYIIIIGENEFNGDFFTIKNLMTGEQKELKLNQIFNHLNDKSR